MHAGSFWSLTGR